MLSYRYGALLFQSLRQANRNLRFIMSKLCGEWFPTQALALVSRATGSHFQGGTLDVVLVKKAGVLGLNMVNPSGIVGKESQQSSVRESQLSQHVFVLNVESGVVFPW